MNHPLIPSITEIAKSIAQDLNLEIVNLVFQTNKNPPLLRIDIRNLSGETSLDDCEKFSRLLEENLDAKDIIPSAYMLEISSPGIGENLTSDREFISFKGFPVIVETNIEYKKHTQWHGNLQSRDEKAIHINCKGKMVAIPREIVTKVQLENNQEKD
ncbi:clustered with transcription termination protein NusA [Geminocystis sp. NIES-3708]|uniref:ribosome maturation factor RimP n=1 Tax=Geminocystis sp. NIES-3708 TaxID=1615909 RepID=UPI0005FC4E04|nr:ribosome maturation factor RimP [Geminocystis sp. NIES-3708]BAQ61346.1 clustered with transcription termination protein NusA [Geminocystis sp. NIES-3708]